MSVISPYAFGVKCETVISAYAFGVKCETVMSPYAFGVDIYPGNVAISR